MEADGILFRVVGFISEQFNRPHLRRTSGYS